MTSEILMGLARVNLAASAAVLVVLALRAPVARDLGAKAAYRLWSAVPLAAIACLIPARIVTLHQAAAVASEASAAGPSAPRAAVAVLGQAAAGQVPVSMGALVVAAWAVGAVVWAATLAWRQHRFSRALGPLRREAGFYRTEAAGLGPVLVGALRPRIVLPADFEERFTPPEQMVVLAHEQAHLRAGDHLVNAVAAALQCLCWFNPLAHIAAADLRMDQELACDAEVVASHPKARRAYAEAMLKTQVRSFAAPLACQWPAIAPLALKQRIAMLKAVPPSAPRRLAGLALAAVLSLGAGVVAWAAQPPRVQTLPAAGSVIATATAAPSSTPRAARRSAQRMGADLVRAIKEGRQEDALALIDAGADLDHVALGDGTPLVMAARYPDMVSARRLVARGADVNRAVPGDGNPLIVASAQGHKAFAALLLANGADINAFVLGDETPLIAAVRNDNLGMVRFLVERGADVNLTVPTGNWPGETRSPLSVAGDPLIADYLRSRGARG